MSWVDKLKNKIKIQTGDGKFFFPLWIPDHKRVEYNVAEFDFPNVEGTLVKRGTPLGRKYNLKLFFVGENHLDDASDFEDSAKDNRPWTIMHPYYGTIVCQPTSLDFDNTSYNVTEISGTVIETITEGNPITRLEPKDVILSSGANMAPVFTGAMTATPAPADVNLLAAGNQGFLDKGIPIITIPDEVQEFSNLFSVANAAVNNAIASPLLAIRATINLINKPAQFSINLKTRLGMLNDAMTQYHQTVPNITTTASKQIYQITAGSTLTTMALAVANPFGRAGNSNQILSLIDMMQAAYDQYIVDLDELQSANGGNPNNFIPNPDALTQLNALFTLALANLFSIALGSKQERSLILEKDTNWIMLTHRVYGLDALDENINELMEENNLGLRGLTIIKKNTKIFYYI